MSVTYGSNKTYLMYLLVFYIWEMCLEMILLLNLNLKKYSISQSNFCNVMKLAGFSSKNFVCSLNYFFKLQNAIIET